MPFRLGDGAVAAFFFAELFLSPPIGMNIDGATKIFGFYQGNTARPDNDVVVLGFQPIGPDNDIMQDRIFSR